MGVERANKLGFKAKGALSKEFTEVPHFSPVQLLYGKVQQLCLAYDDRSKSLYSSLFASVCFLNFFGSGGR